MSVRPSPSLHARTPPASGGRGRKDEQKAGQRKRGFLSWTTKSSQVNSYLTTNKPALLLKALCFQSQTRR